MSTSTPITSTERIEVIDILRGFAIFGILIVNMGFFSQPFATQVMALKSWHGLDWLAHLAVMFFAEGKFVALFSFLFGFGLSIQMLRAQAKGTAFVPIYLRRLAVLLGIGLVHAYLIWAGDILVTYAVLGFFLFLLRNKPDKTLLRIAAACLIFALALNLALFGLTELSKLEPKGEQNVEESYDESEADYRDQAKREENAFAHGSYAEIMRQRVEDNIMNYIFSLFTGPNVFAMFLLGFYTGRRGIFHNIPDNMPLIRRVWRVGLIVGLIANTVHVLAGELSDPIRLSTLSTLSMWGYVIGGPSFALFYLTSIVRLVQTPAWHRRLSPLAYVGRMALSNYLLQSLICTTLFYNYGFGLFGKLGPAAGLALTVAIYTLQIPLSKAWLSRYRFGPVEWLWRSLTYSRRMPIRQSAS